MKLNAGCKIVIRADEESPATMCLRPQTGNGQTILASEITIEPSVQFHEYQDPFGNCCQRIVFPKGDLTINVNCTVDTADHIAVDPDAEFTLIQHLPTEALQYLLQSRYCQSDLLQELAKEVTDDATPGYGQVEAIRSWIEKNFKYEYGVSTASTSAMETIEAKAGVCRDFSHVGIALCRALQIPARIVGGYLYQLDPMDLHAWFEAFVGGRWYTFDATQKEPRGNRIVMAYGRDAADVAQISEYGPIETTDMSVWVKSEA